MPIRLVSDNDEASLQRAAATQDLSAALVALAANLLRVVRGAGKPHEVGRDVDYLLAAYIQYRKVVGHYPPNEEISNALQAWRWDPATVPPRIGQEERRRQEGIDVAIRGALQIAASKLLRQTTQQSAGETELHQGVRMITAANAAALERVLRITETQPLRSKGRKPRRQKIPVS